MRSQPGLGARLGTPHGLRVRITKDVPVIHLHFTAEDLSRIRFASSPVWETVTSIRTLTNTPSGGRLHQTWREWAGGRLADVDMNLLTALVRPTGCIPDFLVPPPPSRTSSFASGLAQVEKLALSAPTVSVHLQALRRVSGDGRSVLYARTPLGDQLVIQAGFAGE